MQISSVKFLESVLGHNGANALCKAAQRSTDVENVLLSRTVLAWLRADSNYQGNIPGLPESYVSFVKSEGGFTGEITIGHYLHKFEAASVFHLAASVAVAIDENHAAPLPTSLTANDIERLGKSIDLLACQHFSLMKSKKCESGCKLVKDHEGKCKLDLDKSLESNNGKPAAPIPPAPPEAPVATAPQPSATDIGSKPPKAAKIKITKNEAYRKCEVCMTSQFAAAAFTGCLCLRDLAKHSRVITADSMGFVLQLSSAWDKDAVMTLWEAIGRV
jgi:hypothetical protein